MKIAIIGSGNMGGAIVHGLIQSRFCPASDIICTAKSMETLEKLKRLYPDLQTTRDNVWAAQEATLIILAVKPWLIQDITEAIAPAIRPKEQILVSVAAGVSLSQLENFLHLSEVPALFRVIPNTAAQVQESMTVIAQAHASEVQVAQVLSLFDRLGKSILTDEAHLEAGMILASCGTAFALRYIRAAMEAAIELGFKASDAQFLLAQTVKGAAQLLLTQGAHPEVEIDKVTTPGGITIKGLNAMEANGFTHAVIAGIKACR
jgi:pyrroline-5-carboxylate reductase